MKQRRKTIYGTLVVLIILAVFFIKRGKSNANLPTYQGRTVEEWFWGTNGHPALERTTKAARVAFTAMDTNCIPFLIRMATVQETMPNRFQCWLHATLPVRIQEIFDRPLEAAYIQNLAWNYLDHVAITPAALKPGTSPMAEEILAAVPQVDDDGMRLRALQIVEVLVRRRGDKKTVYLLDFLSDPSFEIQLQSAILLSELDPTLTNGLPVLAVAASDSNRLARAIASRLPAPTSAAAKAIMTNLVANLVQGRQRDAQQALQRISSTTSAVIGPSPPSPTIKPGL